MRRWRQPASFPTPKLQPVPCRSWRRLQRPVLCRGPARRVDLGPALPVDGRAHAVPPLQKVPSLSCLPSERWL